MTEPLSKVKFLVPKELAKYVGRDVAKDSKLMAAKGSIPLPPVHLAIVLFFLMNTGDDEVKAAARSSLLGLPEGIKKTVIESPETHPMIIDFIVRDLVQDDPLLESAALNKATHDETIAFMAKIPSKRLVDIIGQNQIRILRYPPIVDVLGENPMTSQALIDRLVKFLALQTGAVKEEEKEKPPTTALVGETPMDEEMYEDSPFADEMEIELPEGFESPWADAGDLPDEFMTDAEEDLSEDDTMSLVNKISNMGVSDKIKLAMMGNKEARGLLIRDSNKIVASAALNSPRMTDGEIESISASRSVSEDIIRQIANNREFVRNYSVKLNLVNNVKTPFPVALRFLKFLTDRDLSITGRSKNIPGPVSGMARKELAKRRDKK